jgi:hypothetical protein
MEKIDTGLSFHEYGIAEALTQHILDVPLNQRSYAWTDQVQTLFTDLSKAFDAGESIYFLGMIVLTPGRRGNWEIADGQQRLATTSILIAAIRNFILDLGDKQGADKYQEDYLIEYEPRSRDYRQKLNLNFEDNDFFLQTILKPPKERVDYKGRAFASHERLKNALEYAETHVKNITATYTDSQEKLTRLYDWMDFLRNSARVIVISVPGHVGSVFKMFETLNARGVPASQADILKNYLFDKGKDRLLDLQPRWASMLSTIDSLGDDDLLINYIRHYWIAHNGPTTGPELGSAIETKIKSERQAIDLVAALDSFSSDYIALYTPREQEHKKWTEFNYDTRNCIYTMTRELRVAQILPLLLSIFRYFRIPEAQKAFTLCLSWSVRFLVSGVAGGGVIERNYGTRAKEISDGEIKTVKELSLKMAPIVPNDETFKSAFAFASVRRTNVARYYLRAIDLYQKGEKYPQFIPNEDTKAVNLEHILPENPGPGWKVAPDVAANYYRHLGNMCLLGSVDNSKIGNSAFKDKKPAFKDSPYLMTDMLKTYTDWGPKEISERQNKLAELAPKVWPIKP